MRSVRKDNANSHATFGQEKKNHQDTSLNEVDSGKAETASENSEDNSFVCVVEHIASDVKWLRSLYFDGRWSIRELMSSMVCREMR